MLLHTVIMTIDHNNNNTKYIYNNNTKHIFIFVLHNVSIDRTQNIIF